MIWFKVTSLVIAGLCLTKAVIALLVSQHFYAWRRRQYASPQVPKPLLVIPVALGIISLVSWYVTLTQDVTLDWVVSLFLTAAAVLGARNLLHWEEKHMVAVLAIDKHPVRLLAADTSILVLGTIFLFLGLVVY